jgi:hypothetical protein
LYVQRFDTIGVSAVIPQVAIRLKTDTIRYSVVEAKQESSLILKDTLYIPTATYNKVPIAPAKYDTLKVVFSLSREFFKPNQSSSRESYTGLDSDSGLYSAVNGLPIVNLLGEYKNIITGKSINMIVEFDPGVDKSFQNVKDNRIRRFSKSTIQNGVLIEDISYLTSNASSDSIMLISNKKNDLESDNCIYYSLYGADREDHNQNTLARVIRVLQNVSDTVKNMKITMIPDNPVRKGEIPSSVSIVVILDYGKNETGTLSGRIYYNEKKFTGIYESTSGKSNVVYNHSSKLVTLDEF